MKNNQRLKILDICMLTATIIILLIAILLSITNIQLNKPLITTTLILTELIICLSVYRHWLAYPEYKGLKAPLFVPKAVGLGWTLNSRNPVGLTIDIILAVFILYSFGKMLI